MAAVGRCLATFALLVVICSAHAAVAQNGWYVVPNDYLNPPDDAYHRGINAKDTAEKIKWYRIAADQGDRRAQDIWQANVGTATIPIVFTSGGDPV
jgi:hypothetical protein